jgi:hypothetical protein
LGISPFSVVERAECYTLTYSDPVKNAYARLFPTWISISPGDASGKLNGVNHRVITVAENWKRVDPDSADLYIGGSFEALNMRVTRVGDGLEGRAEWWSDVLEPGPKPSMRVVGVRVDCGAK